ncbi:MAG: hypothetical protein MK185_16170 [Saccharospirillaceae bacterium]|jgi:multidrug resistance efflux pump|nr:hypothetical protein A3759_12915 [Thalassolituus sp. HI0120]MCH2042168.1 hypothetical protein [Saccharospirillaceae bacterium]
MDQQQKTLVKLLVLLAMVVYLLSVWHQQRDNPYDAEAFFGAEVTPVPEPVTIGLIAARDAESE